MKITEIDNILAEIEAKYEYRKITDYKMVSSTTCIDRDGLEYGVLCSNNYLGFTHALEVHDGNLDGILYGTGSGSSRLISGSSFELSDFEKEIAGFKGAEDAIVFNTGYMANLGVLYALAGKDDVIFSDSLNHASIIDGCRISRAKVVVYDHSNMADLENKLMSTEVGNDSQRFIVSDGVFSMDGDIAKLPELVALKEKYNACLIIDDAHALGVIGEHGGGTADYYEIDPKRIDIQIGTMSKALGAEGGFAASTHSIVEYLRNRSRPFIFSTALPPGVARAAYTSLQLLKEDPKFYLSRLWSNARYMRRNLIELGLTVIDGETPIIPIVMGDSAKALEFAEKCRDRGVLVYAIRPPAVPEGTSRIRVTVTAAHSKAELDSYLADIKEVIKEL